MNTRFLLVLSSIAFASAAFGQTAPGTEFRGKLDSEVEPGKQVAMKVIPAPPDVVADLPAPPAEGEKVWVPMRPMNIKGKQYLSAIAASATGEKTLWLDRNGDGKFGADEHWSIPPGGAASLDLPWDNGIYKVFPLRVQVMNTPFPPVPQPEGAPAPEPTRVTTMIYNFNIDYSGSVLVDGKPMRVEFYPLPAMMGIDIRKAGTGVDADFDGKVERDRGEVENGSGTIPVFKVGAHFLAVKTADVATGELTLEERPRSEYTKFDASPGQTMPDFSFVDLDGGQHKLSDYRGKVVLLDFWGTWCGPCIAEMKLLDPVYRRLQPRGFEIIGMDMERTAGHLKDADYEAVNEKTRKFIAKVGHPWVQATQKSIEHVALDVIHVNSYPTLILIGPDGKVISHELRDQALVSKLDELLGASKS